MHAVENNYRTVLIEDACRGVNEHEIDVKRAELNENGCIFVDSDVVRRKSFFFFFIQILIFILRYPEW
jgi:nicotinamidase-related amidase